MSALTRRAAAPAWMARLDEPVILLLIAGSLIGMNFPLGKLGAQAGVSPLLWALVISAGAALALLPMLLLRGELGRPSLRVIRYSVISSLVSFVGPNLLVFSAIPHTGAGYTGLMFALSPVLTTLLAGLLGLRTPGRLGRLGIAVGLAGAVVVSLTRGLAPGAPAAGWLLAALLIPVGLAVGNVYRSLDWPEGTPGHVLAFWGQAVSSGVFIVLLLGTRGALPVAELWPAGAAVLVQMMVAALSFPFVFRLQRRGGPVLLSQMGYVAAAVGLVVATLALGERYPAPIWVGALILAAGIGITIVAQRREAQTAAPLKAPSGADPRSARP
jgi:drug/metabolite transporter (DMT)-like permease